VIWEEGSDSTQGHPMVLLQKYDVFNSTIALSMSLHQFKLQNLSLERRFVLINQVPIDNPATQSKVMSRRRMKIKRKTDFLFLIPRKPMIGERKITTEKNIVEFLVIV